MYDVIIIGAGVSGSAIARELSRYQGTILCTGKRGRYLLWDIQSEQWDCSCRI